MASKKMTYALRQATLQDVTGMTDVFFRSFNSKFWKYFCPDTQKNRAFIGQMWERGINTNTDRSFVAVKRESPGLIVGVSRWQLPHPAGKQNHDAWPEPGPLDQSIAVPFFGGMDDNRAAIMKDEPHWYLDMMGVHEEFQGNGIAQDLIEWGIKQADDAGETVFLHATEAAQTFYTKKYGFEYCRRIAIPDRPEYGSYDYVSMKRKPRKV